MDTQKNPSANSVPGNKKETFWKKLSRILFGWIPHKKKVEPLPDPNADNSIDSTEVGKLYGTIKKEVENFSGPIIIPEIEKKYILSIKYMIDSGYFDGVSGIRKETNKEIEKIAESRAEDIYTFSTESLESRKAKLEEQLKCYRKIKERNEQEDKLQHEYYDFVIFNYRFHPRNYSLGLFLLYGASFIILFIADLPLAVKLIQNGFDLSDGDFPVKDLFKSGMFIKTIKENWEVIFTALGISTCTVYIKMIYDEFIGTQYGHNVISQKKFLQVFSRPDKSWSDVLTDQEKKNVTRDKRMTDYWKFVILGLTLSTLIVLAFFRREAWEVMKSDLPVDSNILFLTFLALTLMFPVISGVCLSLALTNWQNRRRLRRAKIDCNHSYRKFEKSLKEVTKLEEEYADLNKKLEKWKHAEVRTKKIAGLLLSYYQQGYNIGITKPDWQTMGKSFFEKVVLWQSKAVAKKINSNIVKLNQP